MNLSQYIPNLQSSYTWFFYLGIVFFISHIFLYGLGLNLSYFGLLLIYIGARKPFLSNWFRNLLWVFIVLDIYANITMIRDFSGKMAHYLALRPYDRLSRNPSGTPSTLKIKAPRDAINIQHFSRQM